MNRILIASLALLVSTSFHIPSAAAEEEAGFTNIFDGKTLKNGTATRHSGVFRMAPLLGKPRKKIPPKVTRLLSGGEERSVTSICGFNFALMAETPAFNIAVKR